MAFIKKIIIVGGGTAGWMAAASLSHFLSQRDIQIILIESAEIGTIGVGEATLPGLRDFNNALGIDEIDFIIKTRATFKLGIEFNDWKKTGSRFFHPFANYGVPIDGVDFHQLWQSLYKEGKASELEEYCLPSMLAKANKFAQPNPNVQSPLAQYHYAYHFDASRYAEYLRDYALAKNVTRVEGKILQVKQDDRGYISSVVLDNQNEIAGDLFIDCSGLRGLLIEQTLQTGFEDWSHWLPMNSAVAVQSESQLEPTPFTRTTAQSAGWQWRIPLQQRVGNGYVFCDNFISDDEATTQLVNSLDGPALTTPRVIKFTTGRRKQFWNKNCIALGLASGFLEPLESTSISLIQTGISKLLAFFPNDGFNELDIAEANRMAEIEMLRIRDFLILHYVLSERDDSSFWQYIRNIDLPPSLQQKINAYKRRGNIVNYDAESFGSASWLSIYTGFGVLPEERDLKLDLMDTQSLANQLANMRSSIAQAVKLAKSHGDFLHTHNLKM